MVLFLWFCGGSPSGGCVNLALISITAIPVVTPFFGSPIPNLVFPKYNCGLLAGLSDPVRGFFWATAMPLCPLYRYTVMPLYRYTVIPLCRYAVFWLTNP